ncbi:23S rRNA (adenine1618-N6)-methyltransferase [Dyadobacter jejuensis]|uniref:Ribosomal RNA large subunit methyltransferase F n=1 Tax=Dyadobacter jejuensis TaxID=1082580 RepID=A0A316AMD4_9BACT|nr:23S rRNA (adenine(1618)-N(6))-methyltransferase RlmF [Dyadobacter jejuensis]PWJ58449.1 23S rRNA (adenine1618-N6)-methyltransferase [Dyadobacter jejuensis]
MSANKSQQEKARLHPRNKNKERYDLEALLACVPELKNHIAPNKYGQDSVDFFSPLAVKLLNRAILYHYYGLTYWDFPEENLCPPIPGRADYIHHMADLLAVHNFGRIPVGQNFTCLDVGVGANCIYPIIGVTEYDWHFIGSEIDPKSIDSAQRIVEANASLQGKIECRLQTDKTDVFFRVIGKEEKFDISICNPPFHASAEEATKGTKRKLKNLTNKQVSTPQLNFAGVSNELIYEGGEYKFVHNMIRESAKYSKNCFWFSTLVSKQSNLKGIYSNLDKYGAVQVETIPMGTGNKSTRLVAWTFLTKEEQTEWRKSRWSI